MIQKKIDFEKLGYTYKCIWEHEFRNRLKQSTNMSDLLYFIKVYHIIGCPQLSQDYLMYKDIL